MAWRGGPQLNLGVFTLPVNERVVNSEISTHGMKTTRRMLCLGVTLAFLLVVAGLKTLWAVRTFVVVVVAAVVDTVVVVARIVVVAVAVETIAAEGVVAVEAAAVGDFAASFEDEAVTYWRMLGSCPCSSVQATVASVGWAASMNWVR